MIGIKATVCLLSGFTDYASTPNASSSLSSPSPTLFTIYTFSFCGEIDDCHQGNNHPQYRASESMSNLVTEVFVICDSKW